MELSRRLKSSLQAKYLAVVAAGAVFPLAVREIFEFKFRHALAIVGGVVVLSAAMVCIQFIDDFLIFSFIFNLPFSNFSKWLFLEETSVPARGISLGLAELLITMAYVAWFSKVFISRTEPFPKFHSIDVLIFLSLLSQFISFLGAPNKPMAFYDIVYNVKHVLIYFFFHIKSGAPISSGL